MKNYVLLAEILYNGGWRENDKSELIKEYDLTLYEANEIVYWLREFELRDM